MTASTEPAAKSGDRNLLLSGLVLLLLVSQVILCFLSAKATMAGNVDFRAFYGAATILRSGHAAQLYDYDYQRGVQNAVVGYRSAALPFLYPPFAALQFVPLTVLPYRTAFWAMLVINVGLLFWAARLLQPWLLTLRHRGWLVLPALFGCAFATSVALMQGQITFVLLVAFCGGYALLRGGKPYLAGLAVSVALMKYQIALPVLLLFVLWRQWRFVLGFLTGAVCAAGVCLAMVGPVGLRSYWSSIFGVAHMTALDPVGGKARYGMFPTYMPNIHGLTFALSHGARWGTVLNVLLCCAVIVWAARQKPSLLVALPAAVLVSYHILPHDLTLILLPTIVAADYLLLQRAEWKRRGGGNPQRWWEIALLCSIALMIMPLAGLLLVKTAVYLTSLAVGTIMLFIAKQTARNEELEMSDVPATGFTLAAAQR